MCVVSLYYHSIPRSLSTNIAHVTFDHKYYAYPTKAVSLHASLLHASVAGLLLWVVSSCGCQGPSLLRSPLHALPSYSLLLQAATRACCWRTIRVHSPPDEGRLAAHTLLLLAAVVGSNQGLLSRNIRVHSPPDEGRLAAYTLLLLAAVVSMSWACCPTRGK